MGKQYLAAALKSRSSDETITHRQEAVRELVPAIDLRQEFTAKARLADDSEKLTGQLRSWTGQPATFPTALAVLNYLLPFTSTALITGFVLTHNPLFLHFTVTVFIVNLVLLGSQFKKMNREIAYGDNINTTLLRYSQLLTILEQHSWQSALLRTRQGQLASAQQTASGAIHVLSRIFADLESLQNGFGAIILNSTMLYHVHAYRKLLRWKSTHARDLTTWLDMIGEMEILLSFANLSFNNPDFCFPELNTESRIVFEEIGHPLIPARKRVTNSIAFTERPFIILTGSNMSGKSTFLRTLGINFVLANAGAPVCAQAAAFHPMEIVVSMRLSDSLTDSESYFFAEVRRLKEIMDKLDENRCFVLLDEILRGTNSDDKRSGTIAVVKNVLVKNAIGAIATHDLEVCQTTNNYPDKLVNKCFEVEIINNDLHFDYKLRDGICQNKSATFLMTKMGVI
jgi:DNA mismatch repair ATPase MutS